MRRKMVLVADAGVLVSAIAYRGLENTVLRSRRFRLLVTKNVFEEVARTLTRKLGLPEEAIAELAASPAVEVVEGKLFESRMKQAEGLMGSRHTSDVPTVALALAVANDGIWSSDKDFRVLEGAIKVWSSRELFELLDDGLDGITYSGG